MDQEFDGGSLYRLRSAAAAHAAAAGMSRDRVYELVVAAHELAANTVRHGPGHGRFRMWADANYLYCEVSDSGLDDGGEGPERPESLECPGSPGRPGRPARAEGELDGTVPWPAEHGHGLWVVAQVSDEFTIDRGPAGTTATARFAITPPAQRSS